MKKKKRKFGSMRDKVIKNIKQKKSGMHTKFILPENKEIVYFEPSKIVYIDVIPYEVSIDNHPDGVVPGELWWAMPYKLHVGIGADEKAFVCPQTINKRCPICDYRSQLIQEGYEKNKEMIQALNPKRRYLLQVIDVKNRDKGIQLWDVSYHNFIKQLENEIENGEEDYADFAMPDCGLTLKVRFTEEKLGKFTYMKADRIDFLERDEQYDDDIIDEGYQLDKMLRIIDGDKLADIFFDRASYLEVLSDDYEAKGWDDGDVPKIRVNSGRDDDEEEDDEMMEEEEETRRKPSKKTMKKRKIEEDDYEDEEEDEDEEEPRPKKSRRPKRKIEDDDDIDDEEEEEEKPKKKKKAKNKCPFGHRFGEDTDRFDDCDECDVWEECSEAGLGDDD